MARASFNDIAVTALSAVVPLNIVRYSEEARNFGSDAAQLERIRKTIGLDQRRVAGEGITAMDLCLYAAEDLLDNCGLEKSRIDGIVFVTQTPDHFQPCNAAIAHGRLGLSKDCAAFDVNLGCSGYVYGLWQAYMMIASESCENVLLLAGDTLSKCTNPRDRSVRPLFGDGGTASLVSRKPGHGRAFFELHTDGSGSDTIKVPAGAFRLPKSEETGVEMVTADGNHISPENIQMDGGAVFNFSISVEPESIKSILEYSGASIDEVDKIIFHQANKYIISNIVRRLKLPLSMAPADTVEKYGNQSSASIPSTICDAISADLNKRRMKLILSGFGVGLSWATAILDFDLDYCSTIIER